MYSKEQIKNLLRIIGDAKLSMPSNMPLSISTLQKICNGVGSESMPEDLRKAISKVYECAEATAMIHDVRYTNSDGTVKGQKLADDEFLQNGMAEVKYRYAWYSPYRWWAERKVLIAYRLLQQSGESAWCVAFRNNVLKSTNK